MINYLIAIYFTLCAFQITLFGFDYARIMSGMMRLIVFFMHMGMMLSFAILSVMEFSKMKLLTTILAMAMFLLALDNERSPDDIR